MHVALSHKDGLKLIKSADGRPYDFRVSDDSPSFCELELWVDGSPTSTKVRIFDNGNWNISTEV